MARSFAGRTDETRDDWQTPRYIVDALGQFDLDPCANKDNPFRLALCGYPTGGLVLPWYGRIWYNPPYGSECRNWIRKLNEHGNGIALIPPRVGSHWFQQEVLNEADAVLFIKGRIQFLNADLKPVQGNNTDSILIAFGASNSAILKVCGISGKYWRLKHGF